MGFSTLYKDRDYSEKGAKQVTDERYGRIGRWKRQCNIDNGYHFLRLLSRTKVIGTGMQKVQLATRKSRRCQLIYRRGDVQTIHKACKFQGVANFREGSHRSACFQHRSSRKRGKTERVGLVDDKTSFLLLKGRDSTNNDGLPSGGYTL